MIESSENFDITLIKGKVLNQVCIGLYQVILNFDDDISISCESKIYIWDNKITKEMVFPSHIGTMRILKLLGQQVVDVELDKNETLLLTFSGEIVVEIECENDGYESFQISIGKNFMIA